MAASNIKTLTIGLTAGANIAQYQAVQASGAAATAGGNAVGFAEIAADSGQRVPVTVLGTALAIAGGTITPGAQVEVGSTVTKVIAKNTGVAIGRYLGSSNAADGDVIEVLLIPN